MSNRIGPQMKAATAYVARNPGCPIRPVAMFLHVGAARGTNNALGYNPVHRAIDAGLIKATVTRGVYSLEITDRGIEAIS
jgi:hypothetical protein